MVEKSLPPQETVPDAVAPSAKPGRKWPTLLFGLIMLISGAACGVGVMLFLDTDDGPHRPYRRPPSAERITRRIAAACELNEEQAGQAEEIVARYAEAMSEIRSEVATEMGAEFEAFRGEMQEIMTPEQFEAFDRRWERLRRRRHGGRGSHGRRGRGSLLARFDANKDGTLTADEVPASVWQRISGADANGDGAVTQDELDAFRRNRAGEETATSPPAAAEADDE